MFSNINKYLFFMLPLVPEKNNLIEKNIQISFFANWSIGTALYFIAPFWDLSSGGGRLLACFFLLSFIFYTIQYSFQKNFQKWLASYEADKNLDSMPKIMVLTWSFAISIFFMLISQFFFPDIDQFYIKSIFLGCIFGYCLAIASNEILISFFIKKKILTANFMLMFWLIIFLVIVFNF